VIRKVVAVVLIVLAGGNWLYLDYRNKQEMQELEELRRSMEQAHLQALAEAKAVAEARTKFEAQADLNACKTGAEKEKEDFLIRNRKPVRRKPGEFTIPQAAMDEAEKNLETSNAACQSTYDARLKNGF